MNLALKGKYKKGFKPSCIVIGGNSLLCIKKCHLHRLWVPSNIRCGKCLSLNIYFVGSVGLLLDLSIFFTQGNSGLCWASSIDGLLKPNKSEKILSGLMMNIRKTSLSVSLMWHLWQECFKYQLSWNVSLKSFCTAIFKTISLKAVCKLGMKKERDMATQTGNLVSTGTICIRSKTSNLFEIWAATL